MKAQLLLLFLFSLSAQGEWQEPRYVEPSVLAGPRLLALRLLDRLWLESDAMIKFGSCRMLGSPDLHKGVSYCLNEAIKNYSPDRPERQMLMDWYGHFYGSPLQLRIHFEPQSLAQLLASALKMDPSRLDFSFRAQILNLDEFRQNLVRRSRSVGERRQPSWLAALAKIFEEHAVEYIGIDVSPHFFYRSAEDWDCREIQRKLYSKSGDWERQEDQRLGLENYSEDLYRRLEKQKSEPVAASLLEVFLIAPDGERIKLPIRHTFYPSLYNLLGLDAGYCFDWMWIDE